MSLIRLLSASLGLVVAWGAAEAPRAQPADLIATVQDGDADALRTALDAGAPVEAPDADGATALLWAAHSGDPTLLQILLGAGASVEGRRGVIWTDTTRTGYYGSPLAAAAGRGHVEATRLLLKAGADPDAFEWNPRSQAFDGWAALHWAAHRGNVELAALLLLSGATPDRASPDDGMTPLHLAARAGHDVSARQLICAGADPDRQDSSGRSAADRLGALRQPPCGPDDVGRFLSMMEASRRAGEAWQAEYREEAYAALAEYRTLATDLLGPDHGWALTATRNLGHVAYFTDRDDEALTLYQSYLAARDSVLGAEEALQIHDRVLNLLVGAGRVAEIGPHADRVIAIRREVGPPVELAEALLGRMAVAYAASDLERAAGDAKEIVHLLDGVEGGEALREQAMGVLVGIYFAQQEWSEAAALNASLLERISERDGAQAEALIRPLRMAGGLAFAQGDWNGVVGAYGRVVELVERHRGAASPDLIEALQSLGQAHVNRRAFARARPLLDRARSLCGQLGLEPSEPCRKTDASLAELSATLGDDEAALVLRREAVDRLLSDSSAAPAVLAEAHYRLAEAHRQLGALDEAEAQYRASLDASARAVPADTLSAWLLDLQRVQVRDALVGLLDEQGRADEARAIRERVPDVENPYDDREAFVTLRRNQALRRERGSAGGLSIEEDLDLWLQDIRAFESLFGADNLDLADNWAIASILQVTAGNADAARASALRGAALVTRGARDGLAAMSLAEQRLFLDGVIPQQVAALVLAFDGADWTEPYTHVFRWKGMLLQTLRQEAAVGRLAASDPDLAAVRERLQRIRQAFAAARATPGEAARAEATRLAREKERLERRLTARLDWQDPLDALGLDGFRALLPPDAALVDIYRVESALGDPMYAVATVTREALDVITFRALEVDQIVADWHRAASSGRPIGSEFEALGRIEALIQGRLPEGVRRLWVSPDAALVRYPWALFFGLEGRVVTQVASPRALAVLLSEPAPDAEGGILLVGDVDFGDAPAPWAPLPGTTAEIGRLRELAAEAGREATVLRAEAPTPRAVAEALPNARYAHLATHGFFSSAPPVLTGTRSRQGLDLEIAPDEGAAASRNPLAESGLALAGANAGPDGSLTAEELVGLDLSGTRLVVLSACETGRGAEVTGQGVLGLQASLTTAGARSVLMSLWAVPDASTAAFMEAFYEALWGEGLSPGRALLKAQAVVFQTPEWNDPVHWAAWVLVGDG